MPQITQLDNDPTPNNNDLLVTVDMAAGTTKNISREQFFTGAPLPANSVNEQAIADGSVSPAKRAGGFKVGSFSAGGSLGNVSVSGVGFKPRVVHLYWLLDGGSNMNSADGFMDESGGQFARASFVSISANQSNTIAMTNRCLVTPSGTGTTREASFVSMNTNGFTINFNKALSNTPIGYLAQA